MFGLQATACGRELMFGLFEMKYMNICLVAGVILELIALVAILNLYINIRRRERRQKNREDGAGLYDRAVCAGTDEAHMLVRREDISAVSQLMDQKVYRQLRKKYEGWDIQENLKFDARVAGRDGRWLRIIVVPDGTDGCDLFIFRDITEDRGRLESPYSL